MITNKQLSAIHALLAKLEMKDDKKEIVLQYTNGRSKSSKQLRFLEAKALIGHLKSMLPTTTESESIAKMKNKVLGMAHDIGWEIGRTGKIDMERLNNWCVSTSYLKKPFDDYKYNELPQLVSQFERVYKWNTKNK